MAKNIIDANINYTKSNLNYQPRNLIKNRNKLLQIRIQVHPIPYTYIHAINNTACYLHQVSFNSYIAVQKEQDIICPLFCLYTSQYLFTRPATKR